MAVSYAVPSQAYVGTPTRGPITRLLEDERWLAVVLLLPPTILLGLFIAYPFVEGVLLSVTDAKGAVRGTSSGSRISPSCGTTPSSASRCATPSSTRSSPRS